MGTSTVADYCRAIEAHLTRVNGGHLVRVVGPAFSLVREWESAGIPLSVVQRAIDQKAERQRASNVGRRPRPLHIEFCADDVWQLFEDWKRAVGVSGAAPEEHADGVLEPTTVETSLSPSSRRPSLSKHLERVSDRLSRLLGRHDLPESFLDRINITISAVAEARDRARTARGPARDAIAESLRPLDAELLTAARGALSAAEQDELGRQAETELSAFRKRLDAPAWDAALAATSNRLIRERFGLPVIDPDEA